MLETQLERIAKSLEKITELLEGKGQLPLFVESAPQEQSVVKPKRKSVIPGAVKALETAAKELKETPETTVIPEPPKEPQEPPKEPAKEITLKDMQNAVLKYIRENGQEKGAALVRSFGVNKLSELNETQKAELIKLVG